VRLGRRFLVLACCGVDVAVAFEHASLLFSGGP
jgi:hypothetical protein